VVDALGLLLLSVLLRGFELDGAAPALAAAALVGGLNALVWPVLDVYRRRLGRLPEPASLR
jgi:uncharacterized membrane protein YvlD (DUF360 family)